MTLQDQTCAFLTSLGLTIEDRRPTGAIIAGRRTALRQEQSRFHVVETGPAKTKRGSTLIVPSGSQVPDGDGEWFYFEDFLDWTLQSERLAKETSTLSADVDIKSQLEAFVPQNISEAGTQRDKDAVRFFFEDWLPTDESRLLVVLGPAGYGKTLLTYEVAKRLAEAHLASSKAPRRPLPFLVPFGKFRRQADFEGMILSSLQRRGITDYTARAFADLVSMNRVVLFLDGFDELLEERPSEAQKNLMEFIETLRGQGKVLITARSTFFRTSVDVADFLQHYLRPEDVTVIDLRPFDASQRAQVIARMSPNQRWINQITGVTESDGIREAMGSPLLLRETVEALIDGETGFEREESRRSLFATLERSVYKRERVRHEHEFTDKVQQTMLRELAGELLRENARGFEMDLVRVAAAMAIEDASVGEEELLKLADHHFLTVDHQAEEVRFNHQVFREYFQAQWLLSNLRADRSSEAADALSRRPIPEEVAAFFAELATAVDFDALLQCVPDPRFVTSEMLIANVGAVTAASRSRESILRFLTTAGRDVPLTLRVSSVDLGKADFSNRVLKSVAFLDCSLERASFSGAVLQNVSFQNCRLDDADFSDINADIVTIDFENRLFGTLHAVQALAGLGAVTNQLPEVRPSVADEWRNEVREAVRRTLGRFYVPGASGPEGSKWDISRKEAGLYRGLDQESRWFVVNRVLPELVRQGVLSRWREHGDGMIRLEARDEARALIEQDQEVGAIRKAIERLL